MEKLKMKTQDLAQENIHKLTKLFPELITEVEKKGKVVQTINIDRLKNLVGDFADNSSEVYELTWVGKQKSRQKIVMPINKTLRPVPEDSVDFENTENLYIEGDNFEVLKLLQESYLNKIKMIYFDPPYNTGNDFVYKDKFAMSTEKYDEETGAIDEEGNKLFRNTTTNGRFHSDWLSMMYERLVISKDLLRDDGVIFVSIDDNEVNDLKMIMSEIFGEECFKNCIIFKRGIKSVQAQFETVDSLTVGHEYVLMFAKNSDTRFKKLFIELDAAKDGSWNNHWRGTDRPTMRYELFGIIPKSGQWRWSKERSLKAIENYQRILKEINIKDTEIKQKQIDEWYLRECESIGQEIDLLRLSQNNKPEHYIPPTSTKLGSDLWTDITPRGSSELEALFGSKIFDNPKPTELINRMLGFITESNSGDIILDFFAGSCTTAHAVLAQNAEDVGNRRFVMVQLPEPIAEDTEAFKAGYKNISEIGKDRIRRAAKKIKEENKDNDLSNVDFGFRVFKVDSSNMKEVYYNPNEIDQRTLTNLKDNIKEDRTDKDLLYQVLLELAIPISAKVKEDKANKKIIYRVNDNFLIACFDDDVDLETIKKIAELNPLRIIFKDSSFKDDATKVNCDEYLKNKLPNTIVKVI